VYASYGSSDPVFLVHTCMGYVPTGKPVVDQTNGLGPNAEPVQVNVTGLYTQSLYSGVPEPPAATGVKVTVGVVATGCGEAGTVDKMLTDATGITLGTVNV
jgi:hypothetical protein